MNSQTELHCLISREEIEAAVDRIAADISREYRDKTPLIIGVLKGSFVFLADLVRRLDFPVEIDFVRLASYGSSRKSSGNIRVIHELCTDVKGRHIIVVEDIIDTGLTIAFFIDYLKKLSPASLKLCALTDKSSRRQVPVDIDYLGFTVPDRFLVGYGLDYNEQYRYLPDICALGDDWE
jgi:hypoxanthine phosphoribosyltransferase